MSKPLSLFTIAILLFINGCGSNGSDEPVVDSKTGFLISGQIYNFYVQSYYFNIENDLTQSFGSQASYYLEWSANRDSAFFNYETEGNGIWAVSLDDFEPVLLYDSEYSENNIIRIPDGFIFKTSDLPVTIMRWDDIFLETVFIGDAGYSERYRISPDNSAFAFYLTGLAQQIHVVEIKDTAPWNEIAAIPGRLFSWLDTNPGKIIIGDGSYATIHNIHDLSDSTQIVLPQSGLMGLAVCDTTIYGVFYANDSSYIRTLTTNGGSSTLICAIEGYPIDFDSSPFDNLLVLAVSRSNMDYLIIIDLDTVEIREVLSATSIREVRWR